MAFSAVKTFVDGLVLTAAEMNAYISANSDWLKNGIDWMGASDAGDGSRTVAQVRTAALGADILIPVNTTPVDVNGGNGMVQNHRYATGITIPTSGQLLALGGRDADRPRSPEIFLRADLLSLTPRVAGGGVATDDYLLHAGLRITRTSANEILIWTGSSSSPRALDMILYRI